MILFYWYLLALLLQADRVAVSANAFPLLPGCSGAASALYTGSWFTLGPVQLSSLSCQGNGPLHHLCNKQSRAVVKEKGRARLFHLRLGARSVADVGGTEAAAAS